MCYQRVLIIGFFLSCRTITCGVQYFVFKFFQFYDLFYHIHFRISFLLYIFSINTYSWVGEAVQGLKNLPCMLRFNPWHLQEQLVQHRADYCWMWPPSTMIECQSFMHQATLSIPAQHHTPSWILVTIFCKILGATRCVTGYHNSNNNNKKGTKKIH